MWASWLFRMLGGVVSVRGISAVVMDGSCSAVVNRFLPPLQQRVTRVMLIFVDVVTSCSAAV